MLGMKGSALTSLEFDYAHVTNSEINILCKGNRGLKNLSLSMGHESSVTDESVRSIVKYCPGIERVSFVGWSTISNKSFDLLSTLPSLKEISLSCCKRQNISAGIVSLLTRIGGQLEVLKLCGELDRTAQKGMYGDNTLLQCIGECCYKLRELFVDSRVSDNITESTYEVLFRGCPLLETLVCTHLPDKGLLQLAKYCPRLLKLELYTKGLSDAGIVSVTSRCIELKSLRLQYADQLTNRSILSLAEHCKSLEDIFLSKPLAITDLAMTRLFQSCTRLTAVSLYAAQLITDRSIEVLISCCPRLKELILWGLYGVSDISMAALARVPTLERLRLEYSPNLTDDTVRLIAQHCKKLKHVALTRCPLVTAQALIALLSHGKRLIDINIRECTDIILTPEINATYLVRRPTARRLQMHLDDRVWYI